MRRFCYQCKTEIFECMGSVHAGDFVRASAGEIPVSSVRELCIACATALWLAEYSDSGGKESP